MLHRPVHTSAPSPHFDTHHAVAVGAAVAALQADRRQHLPLGEHRVEAAQHVRCMCPGETQKVWDAWKVWGSSARDREGTGVEHRVEAAQHVRCMCPADKVWDAWKV